MRERGAFFVGDAAPFRGPPPPLPPHVYADEMKT